MSELRKAAQQALEALKNTVEYLPVHFDDHFEAIEVLKAALAQPERKPLTDETLMALLPGAVRLPPGWKDFARAIEKAHGIGVQS